MYANEFPDSTRRATTYTRSADGRESWTPVYRTTAWDHEGRNETVRIPANKMVARNDWPCKFAGCGDRSVIAGQTVIVKRDGKWGHETCPKATTWATAPNAAAAIINDADGADTLLNEYDALRADQERKAAAIRKPAAATMTRKAIYRVHLTGDAKRYGVDYVNVALVPNERYGSVKVSEYRGESIGVVKANGSFMFWQSVEQNDARVQAIKAAADIILNAADPIQYAKSFAVESQSCMRCGDDLVDDTSRARLLGPTCFKKWGE
jgi:hypothetical protein